MKFPNQPREQVQVRVDRDQIAQEAFKIWQAEGCPEGRAEAHWQQAEERLGARNPSSRAPADRSPSPSRRGV